MAHPGVIPQEERTSCSRRTHPGVVATYLPVMLGRLRGRLPMTVIDVGLAFLLALLAILELAFWWHGPVDVEWWSYPLAVLMTVPLLYRRSRPELVMAVVGGAGIIAPVLGSAMPNGATFGIVVALYSIATHGTQRDAVLSGVITIGVLLYVAFRYWEFVGIAGAAANYLIFGTAWALGWAARNRRLLLRELEARAERAERTREQQARQAVAEERARIARELHDVVAHAVSVMVVQAGAARRQLDRDGGGAREAVAAVESTGRRALEELRRLLGVLREADEQPANSLAPQPSLRSVVPLIESFRSAGLQVDLTADGLPDDLPAGVDVSAYRVVQEALTNVLKHAGPDTAVTVAIHSVQDEVVVEVADDGRGAASDPQPDGQGHGLVGMRERVGLYDGALETGPRPGGGYLVRARFPFRNRSTATVGPA